MRLPALIAPVAAVAAAGVLAAPALAQPASRSGPAATAVATPAAAPTATGTHGPVTPAVAEPTADGADPSASPGPESSATPTPATPAAVTLNPVAATPVLVGAPVWGTVSPTAAGRTVTLQRSVGGRWWPMATTRTYLAPKCRSCTTRATFYRFAPTSRRVETWTIRTVVGSSGGAAGGTSPARSFVFYPALRPYVYRVSTRDVPYTYRSGCPVAPSGLRRVVLTYIGLNGQYARGELIVHASVADEMARVFGTALGRRFPIQRMARADAYRGSDPSSMRAGNTSAFNCRKVTGNPYRLSRHSWGDAIDVNPFQNPYQDSSGRWWPSGSASYRNRSTVRPGMHTASSAVPRAMRAEGWPWGARWSHPDYHHFSRTGQ